MLNYLNPQTILRVRQNHALEHGSIHLLSSRHPTISIAGRSDSKGFFILGNLPTDSVEWAARTSLQRLLNGEKDLAIHPNCGTNLLASGTLAAAASFLTLLNVRNDRWQQRLERLPLAILATIFALIIARPLGNTTQRYLTTSSDVRGLRIGAIKRFGTGRSAIHRIMTKGDYD
jgi:hypothetical protein